MISSYPRTETDSFPTNFNFIALIDQQQQHPLWGRYISFLLLTKESISLIFHAATLKTSFTPPRVGKHDDHAHPPIHPTKLLLSTERSFGKKEGKAQKIYELITRHFLACISKDAMGSETGTPFLSSLYF